MGISWIEHNGKKVLIVDYMGITIEKEMVSLLNSVPSHLEKAGGKHFLILTDLTNCYATPGFMEASRKMDKEISSKYQFKIAIVGVTGAKAILLKTFNFFSKNKLAPFDDRNEALKYLTKN